MDKSYKLLISAVLFFIGISSPALATPYTGSDIELHGTDFSSIYGGTTYNDLTGHSYYWGTAADNAIYTKWANLWVKYSVSLTKGNWNIGLNVINYADTLGSSGWYPSFNISSTLNGPNVNNENYSLSIPASSTEVNYAYFNLEIQTAGDYTIKYSWTNDKYDESAGQDANIEIVNAFFDNTATSAPVPEPASILLLATGLAGLAGSKTRKKKA